MNPPDYQYDVRANPLLSTNVASVLIDGKTDHGRGFVAVDPESGRALEVVYENGKQPRHEAVTIPGIQVRLVEVK